MDTEIRGRPSYRKSRDKERNLSPSSSPVQGKRSRPSSATRSEDESDYGPESDSEEIQQDSSTTGFNTESNNKCNVRNCSKSSIPRITVLVILGALLIIVVAVVPVYLEDPVEEKYINCSFDELAKKYPSQDDVLWTSLRIGIEGILNNEKPSPAIYLLLHDGKIPNKNLVKKIVLRSTQCFGPDSKPIELNAKEFSSKEASDDYGVIVELYKEKIKEGSVALIANLNEIPAETARALHAICDTYEPIEHKAVIFLTLVAPKTNKGKPVEIAEKTLLDIWNSKISDYELVPLLTRVTDQVFHLNAVQ